MVTCPACRRRPTKRDGRDHRSRQRYACRPCGRDFTATSTSIFSGYRWPADVILAPGRWYATYPPSAPPHPQPECKAVSRSAPRARHIRTGLPRRKGETTKNIERSHVTIRDRLRSSRGLKTVRTGQRFLEGFEAVQALRQGHVRLHHLVPG